MSRQPLGVFSALFHPFTISHHSALQRAAVMVAIALVSGCTVGPNYVAPTIETDDQWSTSAAAVSNDAPQLSQWWSLFNDATLESYIDQAVAHNKTLSIAKTNILRAHALRKQTGSLFSPTVDANLSHTRQGTSGTTSNTVSAASRQTLYSAGIVSSWELDIFGGLRRQSNASDARLESAIANKDTVLLGIIAEVGRTYFDALGLQKRIEIIEKNITLQATTFGLIEDLFNAGEATEFDLSRARAQEQLTRSRLPDLKAEMKASVFRLSVLLGQAPEFLLDNFVSGQALPQTPDVISTGIRSDVLRRRPDIRMAERDLAAATEEVGAQVAELFPRFFLTGSIGRASSTSSNLIDQLSNTFSFGQLMQWPILSGGRIRAQIDVEKADAAMAADLYEQTVLNALSEVESSLTRYVEKRATRDKLQHAFASQQRAAELARVLFNSGETDFLAVLDAERALTDVEDSLATSEIDVRLNLVTLYAALGGGWETYSSTNTATQSRTSKVSDEIRQPYP
ncbi:MAG: TolC family protein [Pseudomonadales bacterium]|nr:TolC family protein [Pseudomonadales bacterium]